MFSERQRVKWLKEIYKNNPKVDVLAYDGLTVECCKKVGANFILRGIRYVNDFEYEKAIADMNQLLNKELETVVLITSPAYGSISSTILREIYKNGGDISSFIPYSL
jgi:pantetheine-phosphate adenylyltransferase